MDKNDDYDNSSSSEEEDGDGDSSDEAGDDEVEVDGGDTATTATASTPSRKKSKKGGFLRKIVRTCRGVVRDTTRSARKHRRAVSGKSAGKRRKDACGLQGMAWWIGRRGSCLVGLCCTNKTNINTDKLPPAKSAVLVSSDSMLLYLLLFLIVFSILHPQLYKGASPVYCPVSMCSHYHNMFVHTLVY